VGDWCDQGFQIRVRIAVSVGLEELGAVVLQPEIEAHDVGPGLAGHPALRPQRQNLPLAFGLVDGPIHDCTNVAAAPTEPSEQDRQLTPRGRLLARRLEACRP
jgi:hypothetical protein